MCLYFRESDSLQGVAHRPLHREVLRHNGRAPRPRREQRKREWWLEKSTEPPQRTSSPPPLPWKSRGRQNEGFPRAPWLWFWKEGRETGHQRTWHLQDVPELRFGGTSYSYPHPCSAGPNNSQSYDVLLNVYYISCWGVWPLVAIFHETTREAH